MKNIINFYFADFRVLRRIFCGGEAAIGVGGLVVSILDNIDAVVSADLVSDPKVTLLVVDESASLQYFLARFLILATIGSDCGRLASDTGSSLIASCLIGVLTVRSTIFGNEISA